MLTAIIPIDLHRRPKDLINKAVSLARAAQENNIHSVFGHNDRNTKYDRELIRKLSAYPLVTINSENKTTDNINAAALRNLAFKAVKTNYIVLLDVDIYPDFDLLVKYMYRLVDSTVPFYVLPCLYLTKHGTKMLNKNKVNIETLKARFFSFSRKEFLHLASPSSVTILKARDYRAINGFDENYCGHGYEDFDFLVRLYDLHRLINKSHDFLLDLNARSPLFSVGFRRYLGEFCLDALLEKDMVFHLYHEKEHREDYYLARKENYNKFTKIHSDKISESKYSDATLLSPFISLCARKGVSIHDYSALFDNKPGHIDRFDTVKRRIKFLFNR
ncbi:MULTISPECIES: galactosyltransferase-related protein [Aeromonas]|uniref:galactosyltransferase-related protein n=1 Tax=Aeromonas TaxID=642 RepID=UPI0029762CC8|nr:galactosyltransferase-related protein [Aeromonas rivipollensis]